MTESLNLDLYNQIAIRKLKASPEWRWCKLEFIGKSNDVILCGGVPTAFRSGPRKGQRKWPESRQAGRQMAG